MNMQANIKKQPTPAAQVAKLCKEYVKSLGYTCSASSSNYSMGNSVRVRLPADMHPALVKQIKNHLSQYQYGHFDGMTDCYEYSNRNNNIPQTKFLFVESPLSESLYQAAWDHIRSTWHGYDTLPADYKEAQSKFTPHGECVDRVLYRQLSAQVDENGSIGAAFWDKHCTKPAEPVQAVSVVAAYTIEEHTHTKHGFQMWIVILSSRVNSDQFKALADSCKSLGGWYSRAWGTTPGGFAFKSPESAQTFADTLGGGEPTEPTEPTKPSRNIAEKLRTIADKMEREIADKLGARLENTPKRIAQGARARMEGYRLQRTQKALVALATLHESGEVPASLAGISSKSDVYTRMASRQREVQNGFHSYALETGEPRDSDPTTLALWGLLAERSEEEKNAETLRAKVNALKFSSIPGYFRTQPPIVEKLTQGVEPYHSVLEPSAGDGAILAGLPADCLAVAFEINPSLCEVLRLRGYDVQPVDFMERQPGKMLFDFVLMNPPFENLQDCVHVRHAFSFLKPGGTMRAVMSPSFQFRTQRTAEDFRAWLDSVGGIVEALPSGSFKESGTMVETVLVTIEK